MDLSFIEESAWKDAEDRVAHITGMPLLPMDDFEEKDVRRQLADSCFSFEDLRLLALTQAELLIRFGCAWILYNRGVEPAEDWDPDEGNQQPAIQQTPSEGTFVRGFLVTSGVLLLYAARAPGELEGYLKARRIPKPRRVSKDVIRVLQRALPR